MFNEKIILIMKKLTVTILTVLILFIGSWPALSQTATPPEGGGTAGFPYFINSLENLYWIAASDEVVPNPTQAVRLNSYYLQTAPIIDAGASYTWFGGSGFPPIGSVYVSFTGTYDGQGYIIGSLWINNGMDYSGLFGQLGNYGIVKNLQLIAITVHGNNRVGALVGDSRGTVNNCSAMGGAITGNEYVGGLVGFNETFINNCYADFSGGGWVQGTSATGGLVGRNEGDINNSFSHSTVEGQYSTGGLVGYNNGATNINYCYSTGAVSGFTNPGGLVGFNNFGGVNNSFWNILLSTQNTSAGGTGLYTVQMQEAGTYLLAGWDFTAGGNIWALNGTDNQGYPYFRWQGMTSAHIWLGSSSTDWNTAGNWSENSIPSGTVIIPIASATNELVLAGDASATIAQLMVEPGGSLTVQSTSAGTGSLIVTGDASGNISFQRYMDVSAKSPKWHYISAPVSGVAINDDFMIGNSIFSPNGGTNYNFFRWDEDNNFWIIYGSTGEPEAFDDATFFDAKGYALSLSSEGVITFDGTLQTDDVTYSASFTPGQGEGWNMIGNPFTSALAVTSDATTDDKFLTNTANLALLDDNYTALYIWNEGAGYENGEDDYQVIGNPVLGSYSEIDQDYLQPGQAFMAKVSSAGNLQFNEEMQAHAPVDFYKEKDVWPSLELIVKGIGLRNTTAIGFHEGMTKGLDPSYDVGKLKGNPNIALYTRLVEDNGTDFAIQALPDQHIEDFVVPVGIDISTPAVYEFTANQKDLDNYSILLEDRQENTFTDLRWKSYFATISQNGTGRFYLHFKEATAIEDFFPKNKILIYVDGQQIFIKNGVVETHGRASLLTVSDMMGRIVLQQNISGSGEITIPVNLKTGAYLVALQSRDKVVTEKVYIGK
jgi:hypothetical protein